jgi:nitroreductase
MNASQAFSELIATRRSIRDFLPTPIPPDVLDAILDDAQHAPSWSNTQPYRIAVASGAIRDTLANQLCERFDAGMRAQRAGLFGKLKLVLGRPELRPDGDFDTTFAYPADLQPMRRATGHGLYQCLNIAREDARAREAQMRKNFEFFGAPTVIFIFVHSGLREFAVLDAGIYLQSMMLSAHARGLGTCAQGALATWAGPIRAAFAVPQTYKLMVGVSIGFPSSEPVNQFNPGRQAVASLRLLTRSGVS